MVQNHACAKDVINDTPEEPHSVSEGGCFPCAAKSAEAAGNSCAPAGYSPPRLQHLESNAAYRHVCWYRGRPYH